MSTVHIISTRALLHPRRCRLSLRRPESHLMWGVHMLHKEPDVRDAKTILENGNSEQLLTTRRKMAATESVRALIISSTLIVDLAKVGKHVTTSRRPRFPYPSSAPSVDLRWTENTIIYRILAVGRAFHALFRQVLTNSALVVVRY
jgi:hypothetical protein